MNILFCLSNVWIILHHGSVVRVHKKCYVMLLYIFWHFCCFPSYYHHFHILSNIHNRILTNHKCKLVVSNCQQKCNYHMKLRRHKSTWPGYKGTFSNLNLGSFLTFCITFSICRKITSRKMVLPTFWFSEEEYTCIWKQPLIAIFQGIWLQILSANNQNCYF